LRQVHHIYQFRGVRRSQYETIALLLRVVCDSKPDEEAWEALESLAQDEYGSQAYGLLAVRITQELAVLSDPKKVKAQEALAEVISAGGSGTPIVVALAQSREQSARQLALLLVTRLPAPLPAQLVSAVEPLLTRKRAPKELQIAAAIAMLRSDGLETPAASRIVAALVARCSRSRALDRLHRLEDQIGEAPAVREHLTAIENEMEMVCPRCQVGLKRPEMARHLWFEHELILEGQRIQLPWRAVRDWIRAYRRGGNAELLVRCRMMGQHLDPEHGLERVNRLILAYRVDDVEARQMLWAQARQEQASLCPRCYALVPIEPETDPGPVSRSYGRLSARGFSVEVSERGLVPFLTVATPDALIYRGREPGRWLTRNATTLLLAGVPVLIGLALALLLPVIDVPLAGLVAVSLVVGLVVYLVVTLHWHYQPPPFERALDFAWRILVPQLHAKGFCRDDGTFLASLAMASINCGRPERRSLTLARSVAVTDDAVGSGVCSVAHLAPLVRLQAADAIALGEDPLPLLAGHIGRCLEGRRPLVLAERILSDSDGRWRVPEKLARLQVLVSDRAFEAGLEMRDLVAAGRMAPALANLLQTESRARLGSLRLLWSLRARRPWDRWGVQARTVFELAVDPDRESLFDGCSDLLFVDEKSPQIVICDRGLVFKNRLFTSIPRAIEAKARREDEGVRYELIIDEDHFRMRSDATALAQRLRSWFNHFFDAFLGQIDDALSWKAPEKPSLYFQEPMACPGCKRLVLPRPGDVGKLMQENNKRRV
jgi:hypothetical protein